jgi:hypothetical protein
MEADNKFKFLQRIKTNFKPGHWTRSERRNATRKVGEIKDREIWTYGLHGQQWNFLGGSKIGKVNK